MKKSEEWKAHNYKILNKECKENAEIVMMKNMKKVKIGIMKSEEK